MTLEKKKKTHSVWFSFSQNGRRNRPIIVSIDSEFYTTDRRSHFKPFYWSIKKGGSGKE